MDEQRTRVYRKETQFRRRLKKLAILLAKGTVLAGLSVTAVFLGLVLFLPMPAPKTPQATRVYDANGELISSLFVENRVAVEFSGFSPELRQAVVAVEDKRFYRHHGLDFQSLGRALLRNIKARGIVEGGSTITQQAARNLFLTLDVTPQRKFMEMVYTLKLEMRYTKEEILTMYLNQLYMGHGTWGMEVASNTYFGKSANQLSLSESALLAGIIRGPEFYSPYNDIEAGLRRRNLVLGLMVDQGMIAPQEADSAKDEAIVLAGLPQNSAPYFISFVLSTVRERHPEIGDQIYRGGYEIHTTLDLETQEAAEKAFADYIQEGSKDSRGITQPQGALIAIEPQTGYIKAMVGGRNWQETQLNRTYQVKRQPGSAFKMFLYAAVIDQGHPLTETKICEPISFPGRQAGETYEPIDFGTHPYHYAPLTIRQAIAISDNVVAAKWAQEITPNTIIDYARRLGIQSELAPNIPLALGASEVTPLEMTVAAATLSAGGIRPEPIGILKILDHKGQIIEENRIKRTYAISPGTAYVLTSALRSVLQEWGTAKGIGPILGGRPAAGKTGTTDDQLEGWFVGYTEQLACCVYVGWDNREESLPGTGAVVAGPIWAHFMAEALKGQDFLEWSVPDDVLWTEVCADTGTLAWPGCRETYFEVFLRRALPGRRFQIGSMAEIVELPAGTEVDEVPPIWAQEPVSQDEIVRAESLLPELSLPYDIDLDDFLRQFEPTSPLLPAPR